MHSLPLDSRKIIEGVVNACIPRDVTQLILSDNAYRMYVGRITHWEKARGMRKASCKRVGLLPVPFLPDHIVIQLCIMPGAQSMSAENRQLRQVAYDLRLAIATDKEIAAQRLLKSAVAGKNRYVHVTGLPTVEEETP